MKSGTSPGFLTSMTGRKELLSVDEVGYGLSMPARLSELTLSPYTIERKHLNLHFQSNSFSLESLVHANHSYYFCSKRRNVLL